MYSTRSPPVSDRRPSGWYRISANGPATKRRIGTGWNALPVMNVEAASSR